MAETSASARGCRDASRAKRSIGCRSASGTTRRAIHAGDELAAVMIDYQRRFDWDFVKLMPNGSYYAEALGCTLTPPAGPFAINGVAESPIKRPEDWESAADPGARSGLARRAPALGSARPRGSRARRS